MSNKTINNMEHHKIFILTSEEFTAIKSEILHYEDARAASIEALKIIQRNRGWVSDSALYAISKLLNISPSDLEEVATFYNQIFRKPVGRNIIRYCDSIVCFINGYEKIKNSLEQYLNIQTGQTTADQKFTLLPTCCLGNCDKSPTIMINEDTYTHLRPEIINNILEGYQ